MLNTLIFCRDSTVTIPSRLCTRQFLLKQFYGFYPRSCFCTMQTPRKYSIGKNCRLYCRSSVSSCLFLFLDFHFLLNLSLQGSAADSIMSAIKSIGQFALCIEIIINKSPEQRLKHLIHIVDSRWHCRSIYYMHFTASDETRF